MNDPLDTEANCPSCDVDIGGDELIVVENEAVELVGWARW